MLQLDPAPTTDKKADAVEPNVSTKSPDGRVEQLWPMDFGEQVVGSEHVFTFESPVNADKKYGAVASAWIFSPDFSFDWKDVSLPAGERGPKLKIKYSPKSAGPVASMLRYTLTWMDGHKEDHYVHVTATARTLDDAPRDSPAAVKIDRSNNGMSDAAPTNSKTATSLETDGQRSKAIHTYDQLIAAQQHGVDVVEREAATFKPPPVPESVWWQLAEIALVMATAAIAGPAGSAVADNIVHIALKAGKALGKGAKLGVNTAKTIGHAVEAAKDIAIEGVGAAVEDGIKKGAEKGIAAIKPTEAPEATKGGVYSANGDINFFATQRAMLDQTSVRGADELTDLITNLYRDHGAVADSVVNAMRAGLAATLPIAQQAQAKQTAIQWSAYKARAKLGEEKLHTASGDVTVTKMDELRKGGRSKLEVAELAPGVLEIEATMSASREVAVTGARMLDVASITADRLLPIDLRRSGVPIRIVLYNSVVITLDEVGRVRTSGPPLDQTGSSSEEQQIQESERIVRAVLAKPLKHWGLTHVQTNDQNQPRAEPESAGDHHG